VKTNIKAFFKVLGTTPLHLYFSIKEKISHKKAQNLEIQNLLKIPLQKKSSSMFSIREKEFF